MTWTVPVLMYHRIGTPPPGEPYPALFVSVASFRAQMEALKAAGWRTITAHQLGAALAARKPVPAKSIVITFDDGNMDGYTNAFPILQQLGMVATFNVVASGGGGRITWADMATMAKAGMEIANHTLNHRNVSYRKGASLWTQIGVADQRIRARLAAQGVDASVTTFAYPVGKVGPAAVALLASLHYTIAFTEVNGWVRIGVTDPLRAPRIRVDPSISPAGLLALLP